MNAPTPLIPANNINPEMGGSGTIVDRYSDHDDGQSPRFIIIRWQDDRSGRWSKEKKINVGKMGESDFFREISPMGTYRTRQLEFVFDGPFHVALYGLQENLGSLEA